MVQNRSRQSLSRNAHGLGSCAVESAGGRETTLLTLLALLAAAIMSSTMASHVLCAPPALLYAVITNFLQEKEVSIYLIANAK